MNKWIIRVDTENNAEDFWLAMDDIFLPENPNKLVFDTQEQAEAFYAFCKTMPGFSDGPEYARDALLKPIEGKQDNEKQS